jgi:hypothetical protein
MLATAARLYDVEGVPSRNLRNADPGHFEGVGGRFSDMARMQWQEIRRRQAFRVVDAKALMAYWRQEVDRVADRHGWEGVDKREFEVRRWRDSYHEMERRLASPKRVFEHRQEFADAMMRAAIFLDSIRGAGEDPSPFTLPPPQPVPQLPPVLPVLPPPPVIPGQPAPGQPAPDVATPASALAGMGVVLALALAAGAYFLLD